MRSGDPGSNGRYPLQHPLLLEETPWAQVVIDRLGLKKTTEPDLGEWQEMIEEIRQPKSLSVSASLAVSMSFAAPT
ncbi:MAG: hypothetical protein R3C44_09545 [Chloroflexota bacterium]